MTALNQNKPSQQGKAVSMLNEVLTAREFSKNPEVKNGICAAEEETKKTMARLNCAVSCCEKAFEAVLNPEPPANTDQEKPEQGSFATRFQQYVHDVNRYMDQVARRLHSIAERSVI